MLRVPEHVHRTEIGHGVTAVLNVRTGQWTWINEATARIWDAALHGDLENLITTVVGRGHDLEQVRASVHATVATLVGQGLLTERGPWRGGPCRWRRRRACR